MKTKWWAVVFMLVCTGFTAFGQIFMKWGSNIFAQYAFATLVFLALGFSFYGMGAVFNILSLKGGELSFLFPIFALNYIWVSFLSVYYLDEPMNISKWLGVAGIVLGISLIGYGSNMKKRKGRKS